MIRLACALILLAVFMLMNLAVKANGMAATWFSFVGYPALAAGISIYAFNRWRQGALHHGGANLK